MSRAKLCVVCRAPLEVARTGRPRTTCTDACRSSLARRRRRAVIKTAGTVEWATPRDLFDRLDARYGPFTLDAAAQPGNALCERYFMLADDALTQEWAGRVWLNPPYGAGLDVWMRKALVSSRTTAELVSCLVPVRADTGWFHDVVLPHAEVEFLRGRVRFGGAATAAPFASMVVLFRDARKRAPRTELPGFSGAGPGRGRAMTVPATGPRRATT
jgi:phage N-6-adenine-methyltransferase